MSETATAQAAILVPTDFSAASARALPYARALAAQSGAKIHLVHAQEVDRLLTALGTAPLLLADRVELRADYKRRLEELGRQHGIAPQRSECHLLDGNPFDAICDLETKLRAELIVVASHGYGAMRRALLGSTAERIVRHSPCPVLVIHEREHEFIGEPRDVEAPSISITHIVAPTDFSDCSLVGVRHAVALARRYQARITIVHAVNLNYVAPTDFAIAYDFNALTEAAHKAAEETMATFLASIRTEEISLQAHVRPGTPIDVVCNFATESRADLVVTATHGHTGLSHALIGSTAEKLVRYAACPVLVIPTAHRAHHRTESVSQVCCQ